MKWITPEHIRTDRVASVWLIKNFVDPDAEFLFAPRERVLEVAAREQATPFHVSGAELGQRGDATSFEAILTKFNITEPALHRLKGIVTAADRKGAAPEAAGLKAILHGFFLMKLTDERALELELPVFDALYRYCLANVQELAAT